jgi:glycosyltransferase involved in cell wall biosynthesis
MTALAGLRIALVGPLPPPAGGMAMQTRQLAELLRGERADVLVIATNAPYWPGWVGRWRGVRALFRLFPYLLTLWRAAGRSDVMHVMANSGWSWHLFAAPAVWISRLRRVPVVVNYRGGEAAEFLAHSARTVRRTVRHASRLIVPSAFLEEIFGRHGMPAEVVPNIVDLDRFYPSAELSLEPRIIIARNLEPIYDIATAIRAFARVCEVQPGARLLVAGTGPEEGALRRLAAELGVAQQVDFVGRLGRDEMAQRLRESRVALNPSLADNMPNSVLEALASGVPVVSTDVGGVPYIVQDGKTALLVPPGEPEAMAAAIVRLLGEPALAEGLRAAGIASVHGCTWAAAGPLWAAVYGAAATDAANRSASLRRHA